MAKKSNLQHSNLFLRFFNVVVAPFAWILFFAMLLSVLAAFFDPKKFIVMTFFGLAFWGLFFSNLLLLLILVPIRSKVLFISIFTLVVSLFGMNRMFARNVAPSGKKAIRVLTYNVHGFKGQVNNLSKSEIANQMIDFLRFQEADLICIQEFSSYADEMKNAPEQFARNAGFPFYAFKPYWGKNMQTSGLLILSKFQLQQVSAIHEKGQRTLALKAAFFTQDQSRIQWIVNTHLVSFSLQQQEISYIGEARFTGKDSFKTIGLPIIGKLSTAFKVRSAEIKVLTSALGRLQEPAIVCGDFNDTPLSFTYRQMVQAGFKDSYLDSGIGIGSTYAGLLPFLRIDYIWQNKSYNAISSKVLRNQMSDHFAVVADFEKIKQNQ